LVYYIQNFLNFEMNRIGDKRNAVICILRNKEHFVFIERKNKPNRGRYVPIGGKIEPFESPTQAAVREIYEEAGINVKEINMVGVLCETSPIDYNWTSFVFISEVPYFDLPECDEGNLHWISYENIKYIDTPPTTIPIFDAILNNKYFVIEAIYNESLNLLSLIDHINI